MEKIEGEFKDDLINYKGRLGLYIVKVEHVIDGREEYWVMKENAVIAKEPDRLLACEKLGENTEKTLSNNQD